MKEKKLTTMMMMMIAMTVVAATAICCCCDDYCFDIFRCFLFLLLYSVRRFGSWFYAIFFIKCVNKFSFVFLFIFIYFFIYWYYLILSNKRTKLIKKDIFLEAFDFVSMCLLCALLILIIVVVFFSQLVLTVEQNGFEYSY